MKHSIILLLVALLGLSGCTSVFQTAMVQSAVFKGDIPKINGMLSKGYDVNTRDPFVGQTALMLAAFWGRVETMTLLIDRGADVNIRDNSGATALMYASFAPQYAAESGMPPSRYSAIIDLLISKGADVNAKDERGTTALMFAAAQGGREWAERLIHHGADIKAEDINGLPAWIFAALGSYYPEPRMTPLIMAGLVTPDDLLPADVAIVFFPSAPIEVWEEFPGPDLVPKDTALEGKTIYSRKWNHGKYALCRMIAFKPGEIRLKVSYYKKSMEADGYTVVRTTVTGEKIPLTINAEAGHLYAVKYAVVGELWRPWVEEVTKGD